jgi:hypothetical protein
MSILRHLTAIYFEAGCEWKVQRSHRSQPNWRVVANKPEVATRSAIIMQIGLSHAKGRRKNFFFCMCRAGSQVVSSLEPKTHIT